MYKSFALPLNRQLTHCSYAIIENKNLFITDLPSKIKVQLKVFVLSRWDRAVWSAIEIASSVDLFGWYVCWSGVGLVFLG
jgi:hypothetical protein